MAGVDLARLGWWNAERSEAGEEEMWPLNLLGEDEGRLSLS